MKTIALGNYILTEKYHTPCITYKETDEFGDESIIDFTYDTYEDALADMLYFAYEDRMFHGTTEFKQSKQKTIPNKYREILENKYPNVGFIKLNANVITGNK